MRKFTVEKKRILSDNKPMTIYILKPTLQAKRREETPGLLWIHGGGYITGMAKMFYMSRALDLVVKYGAVVVTPEYRLSFQAPYPAALRDCYAALRYMKAHHEELGFSPERIMVGGESAGGGLTAAVCMYARDRKEINIAFQLPLYPMLDDRDTPSSVDNHAPVWNTRWNHIGWNAYLGALRHREAPVYAAPARQTDYTGLPPAYTFVGDRDPFYSETLTYIENLRKAGIPAKVDIYPGGVHAFDMLLPHKKISKLAIAAFEENFVYAAAHYTAPQPEMLQTVAAV